MNSLLFSYYQFVDRFKKEPVDDDDFIDGIIFMEICTDWEQYEIKKANAKRGKR